MSNTFTINGRQYQRQHITPEISMGTSGISNLTNPNLQRLIANGLWEPNNTDFNIIALPASESQSIYTGVTRHYSTSHTGYTRWYNNQVDFIALNSANDIDLARNLIGLNNFLKSEYVKFDSPLVLHGTQADALEALSNHSDFQYSSYSKTAEFELGARSGTGISVRIDESTRIDELSPYDTASGISAPERAQALIDARSGFENNLGRVEFVGSGEDARTLFNGVEINPRVLTTAAIGAEALKHAGIVGDAFEISLAISEANALIASGESGSVVAAEAVYARLAGSLLGGAAVGSGFVVAAGTALSGSGIGVVPGAIILVAAGVSGSILGASTGEAIAASLHGFAVDKLNNGQPIILDELVNFYHSELKSRGIFEDAILTQALVGINTASSDQVQSALIQAVINNPDLADDPAALQAALWDVLVNRSGIVGNSNKENIIEIVQAVAEKNCFGPEVTIDLWPLDPSLRPGRDGVYKQDAIHAKVLKKPIELVEVGDIVVSFNENGDLSPGRVTKTFRNDVKVLLNFHGTRVTPGHVYFRPDSKKNYKFETLIDVLRDDGVIKHQDGTLVRAATNVPVGDARDGFISAITGTRQADGSVEIKQQGRVRLGTRFILSDGDTHKSWSVADLIEVGGGVVEDEMIRTDDGDPMPFHWDFSDTLPKPEDFVLACSGTTLEDIYKAAEWESQAPRLSAPTVLDGGPVQPLKGADLDGMPRNEPLDVD